MGTNVATVFARPEFDAVIDALFQARNAAMEEGQRAMAEGYEALAWQFVEGMHAMRMADLEE